MSESTPTVHPNTPPSPPYWRGVSDLTGEYGDLLYGTYLRSTNVYVKNGTAVAKRRGYERAFDELFWGQADVHTFRGGELKLVLVADGQGIKVISTLPAPTYTGYTIAHPGFPTDTFSRDPGTNTTAALASASLPVYWEEGKDSTETGGPTGTDTFKIASAECQHDSADALRADADWLIEAPTPFYANRVEMDMSSLTLTDDGSGEWYWDFFMGLPPRYTLVPGSVTATVGRERQVAADAHKTFAAGNAGGTCWTGLRCRVKVQRQGTNYRLSTALNELASDKPQSSYAARQGRIAGGTGGDAVTTNLTSGNFGVTWVVEFGRRKVGNGWRVIASVWRNTTLAALEAAGATSTPDLTVTGPVLEVDAQYQGNYLNLPLSGGGGFFGMSSKSGSVLGGGGSNGIWQVNQIKPALTFLNPLP